MSDFCAELAAGARRAGSGGLGAGSTRLATLWQLAAALFEAQAGGLLAGDVYTKRMASRLLAQLRMRRARPERGLRPPGAGPAVLLQPCRARRRRASRRRAWRRCARPGAWTSARRPTTRRHAWAASTRRWWRRRSKRVAAAKDAWSAVAGGETAPPGRPGRAVHARGRFAAAPVPAGRGAGRRRCRPRWRRPWPAAGGAAAGAGDGGRHRDALPRRLARGRRARPPRTGRARAAPGAAHRRRARGRRAAAARDLDGGAVPPRQRPPDHGQRGAGTARLAVRGRKADRPVLPQPGAARAADPGAGAAVGDARRALGAGPGPGLAGGAAHARRRRRAGADRGRPAARRRRPAPSTAWPTTWAP